METWERELHTARILSGRTRVRVGDETFTLVPPSPGVRYAAAELYRDVWQECHALGVMTEPELLDLLRRRKIWTAQDEEQHRLLTEKVDDLKVGLFENWTRSHERSRIRHALDIGKRELARLEGVRHGLDHVTCDGVAASARVRFATGCSLLRPGGLPYWPDDSGWDAPDTHLDDVIEHLVRLRLGEAEVRELCRTDPWRSIWSSRKYAGRGLVDADAASLTDEQRYAMMWSGVYDSIRDSPDCPDDGIVDDDDMLDGWMIRQKREREAQRAKKRGDEIGNEKIRNADEVYLPADTVADARKVEAMNDAVARTIKSQRLATLRSKGTVHEMEMPDTWSRFQGELAKMQVDRMRQVRNAK
jgi:hypothetical protein